MANEQACREMLPGEGSGTVHVSFYIVREHASSFILKVETKRVTEWSYSDNLPLLKNT